MRTGFEVILEATGKAEFHLFSSATSLVTFAQNSATEMAAVLMGKLYYQDDLKTRFPQAFQQDFASDAALALAIFQHYGAQGLEKLEGELALVVFDPKQSCLFALNSATAARGLPSFNPTRLWTPAKARCIYHSSLGSP